MNPALIIAQCPDDGVNIRIRDGFKPPRRVGRLVEFFLECPQCGVKRRLRVSPKEVEDTLERWEDQRPQEIGEAVAFFRRILDEVVTVEDVIEWKAVS